MLARSPSRAAEKKRRYRRRQRDGVISLQQVEVSQAEFVEALLRSHRLSERDALDRDKLARAAASVLQDWAELWLRHKL
jgi:hypothetical protein